MFAADVSPALFLPLLDLALKIAFVVLLAAGAAALARRAAAATRHLLYLCALIAALALPVVGWLVPSTVGAQWQVPVPPPPVQGTNSSALPGTNAVAPQDTTPTSGQDAAVVAGNTAPVSDAASSPPTPAVPASGAASPPKSRLTLREIRWALWAMYALGTAFVLGQVALGAAAVRRLAAMSRPAARADDAALTNALDSALAETGGIRPGAVRLLLAPDATPMTWGWRRPTILLPTDAAVWDPERQRVVLLHEAAHIARRDWPIQMLVHAICALYWFHPLVWWAASRLRAESERACDDRVLLAGVAPDTYAALLLDVAQNIKARQHSNVSTTRFASSMARSGGLKGRLMAIVNPATPRRQTGKRRAAATLGLFALCLLPVSLLHLTPRRADAEGAETKNTEPRPDLSLAYYRVPEDKQWTRDAGFGTTIELMGVSQCSALKPAIKMRSWKPDGVLYTKPLYDYAGGLDSDDSKQRSVELSFRIHHPTGNIVETESDETGAFSWSGLGTDKWNDPKSSESVKYYLKGGLRTIDANYSVKEHTANLRLKIAAGPWQTKKTLNVPKALQDKDSAATGVLETFEAETDSFGRGDVSFSLPMHRLSGNPLRHQPQSGFVVTDTFTQCDADIVAVDTAGIVHRSDYNASGGGSNNTLRQTTVWFDEDKLPFAKIKELRFNLRHFRTVEFRNVSLYPK